jgi:hypothetical protein
MPARKVARLPGDAAGKIGIQQEMLAQLLARVEPVARDDVPKRWKRPGVQALHPLVHHRPAAQVPLQLPRRQLNALLQQPLAYLVLGRLRRCLYLA